MRALVFIALAGCAGTWSKADTALELAYAGSLAVDWQQTDQGLATIGPDMNPAVNVLGPAVYFPAVAIGHAAISALLPSRWREAWQAITLGVEIENDRENIAALRTR